MKNPEIRINFSELLYYGESQVLFNSWNEKGDNKLISEKKCLEKTNAYRKAWQKNEDKILSGMQNILELEFYRPIIDVTLAPMFTPMSEPLMMSFYYEPDDFVSVLTHELFHVLLTDNKIVSNRLEDVDLISFWEKIIKGIDSWTTLVHIPVHAGCKYIFTDVLKEPSRVQKDIENIKTWTSEMKGDYLESWDYVQSHDYKEILSSLKHSYQSLNQRKIKPSETAGR